MSAIRQSQNILKEMAIDTYDTWSVEPKQYMKMPLQLTYNLHFSKSAGSPSFSFRILPTELTIMLSQIFNEVYSTQEEVVSLK